VSLIDQHGVTLVRMTLEYSVKRLRQFSIQRRYPGVAADRVLHIRRGLLAIDGLRGF
jgi:hypothetical protein